MSKASGSIVGITLALGLWSAQNKTFEYFSSTTDTQELARAIGTTAESAPYTPVQKLLFCSQNTTIPMENGILKVEDGRVEYRFRIRRDSKGPNGVKRSVFYFISSACSPNSPTYVDATQERVYINKNKRYARDLPQERFGGQDALNHRLDDIILEAMNKRTE